LRAVTRENELDGSARPIQMLRFVYRVFGLCQSRMGIDPINRILLGSKFSKMVHRLIRPHYLHAPNLAVVAKMIRSAGIVLPLRICAPSETNAVMSENCASPISPLTIRSEAPTLK
jgi:hypothetical protein